MQNRHKPFFTFVKPISSNTWKNEFFYRRIKFDSWNRYTGRNCQFVCYFVPKFQRPVEMVGLVFGDKTIQCDCFYLIPFEAASGFNNTNIESESESENETKWLGEIKSARVECILLTLSVYCITLNETRKIKCTSESCGVVFIVPYNKIAEMLQDCPNMDWWHYRTK